MGWAQENSNRTSSKNAMTESPPPDEPPKHVGDVANESATLTSVMLDLPSESEPLTLTRTWDAPSEAAADTLADSVKQKMVRQPPMPFEHEWDVTVDGTAVEVVISSNPTAEYEETLVLGSCSRVATEMFELAMTYNAEEAKELAWFCYEQVPEPDVSPGDSS